MSDYVVKEDGDGKDIEGKKRSRLSWCDPKVAAFTLTFSCSAIVTQAVGIYVSSQVTTLEKAFSLTSTQSGFINSANDVGFLITVIACSHFARKLHIPRFLAVCSFIYGLASLFCSLPHFIYGSTDTIDVNGTQTVWNQQLCLANDNSTDEYCASTQVLTKQKSNAAAYGIIIMGMIMQGMAKSGRTPLMTVYIDNNVGSRKRTAPYLGIVNAITMFGPSSAFALGGLVAGIYVTLEDTELTPKDPRWVGAWYLGFLVFGGLALITSIPLCFFPKNIKRKHGESEEMDQENVEMSKTKRHTSLEKSANAKSLLHLIKDLLASMYKLSTNVVYVLTICTMCALSITAAGSSSFQPKYLEMQFDMSTSSSNLILGASVLVASVIGNITGGFIVGKFKFGLKGCLWMVVTVMALSSILSGVGAIFGCSQPVINGPKGVSDTSYDVACGEGCECPETDFFQICGADGQNYRSPCVAGCKFQNITFFGDCGCIPGGTATPGLCPFDCGQLIPYTAAQVIASVLGLITIAPMVMVQIYSVPRDMRALSLGMASFFSSLIGWLPGPILYGRVIDTACAVWNYSCGQRGSCAIYDLTDIRIKYHMLTFAFRLTGALFMSMGLIHIYRKSSKDVKITSTKNDLKL